MRVNIRRSEWVSGELTQIFRTPDRVYRGRGAAVASRSGALDALRSHLILSWSMFVPVDEVGAALVRIRLGKPILLVWAARCNSH